MGSPYRGWAGGAARARAARETANMAFMNSIVLAGSEAGRERQMVLEKFSTAELTRGRVGRRGAPFIVKLRGAFSRGATTQSAATAAHA